MHILVWHVASKNANLQAVLFQNFVVGFINHFLIDPRPNYLS